MVSPRHRVFWLFIAVLALTGCRPPNAAPPAPPPPEVTVAKPVAQTVQSYLEYNGYLDAVESVKITARVKGVLKKVHFTEAEGEEVRANVLLYNIDPREYDANVKKADADRLKAVAELKRARSEGERAAKMVSTRTISEEEYQQRLTARETAEAIVKQTEAALESAKLELSYCEIHAPIAGRISRTHVTAGNLVGQGEATLLTTIVSVDPIYVYFDAPEKDLVEYQRMQQNMEKVRVEVGVGIEDGFPHVGEINFQENRVDTATGTVRLRGRLDNPQIGPGKNRVLYPGLFARVRVPDGKPKSRLVLPEDALLTGQEGRFVYIIGPENVVQKRTVTVGPVVWRVKLGEEAAPGWSLHKGDERTPVASVVSVIDGLRADDRVIVNGIVRARPGTPVMPDDWSLETPTK